MLNRAARALALALVVALPACAAPATPVPIPQMNVEVFHRAIAPGEPVRIVVRASEPLRRLSGAFLDRDVTLAADLAGRSWTGWAVVPLDAPAGIAALELLGESLAGAEAVAVLDLEIQARSFPEERLTVEERYVEPPPEVARRIARDRQRTAEVYAQRTSSALDGQPFAAPVPGTPTSVFGKRRVFNGKPRAPHSGLDLRAATGTVVRSAGPGTVALAEDLYYSGNTVIIDHGDGLFTVYAHLARIDVREGSRVERGVAVGLSGATGRVTGPHLHWGAKIGDEPFDPRALLDAALFAPAT